MQTKVATFNGVNDRFPALQRNRTGWTEGSLMRDDGRPETPYNILWDVQAAVSSNVTYAEMEQLVRHHRQCRARKLINLFCVGMDLLWFCPELANPDRLRWVTIMFKQVRYKILFRDGGDAWVTGEAIDKALDAKEQYPDAVKVNAALEKWDREAVGITLIEYGLYCAKHVGSTSTEQSTVTATLDLEAVHPQRFLLPSRQQALVSVFDPSVLPALQSSTATVMTRLVHCPEATASPAAKGLGPSLSDDALDDEINFFFDNAMHRTAFPPNKCALAMVNDGNVASTEIEAATAAVVSFGAPPTTSSLVPHPAIPKNAVSKTC
jgi:hypothetical protein